MPVVYLVRHGQASFGAADYDVLSDLGREQSEMVGATLGGRGLREPLAVAGTLRRQRETATLALAAAGLDVEPGTDGRWDEYDHMGLLQRYPPPDPEHDGTSKGVQALLDVALETWVRDGAAGGWTAFSDGAAGALADLCAELGRGRDGLVFTSGGIIAALCARLLSLPPAGVVAVNRESANGALTKLVVGGSGTSLVSFNDHAHFEGATRGMLTYR